MVKQKIILLYFGLFAFGQLPGLLMQQVFGLPIRMHLTDLLVVIAALIALPNAPRKGLVFVLWGVLINLVSPLLFTFVYELNSFLYAIRILGYLAFLPVILSSGISRRNLQQGLLGVVTVSAAFGWLQYLTFPDLRTMKLFGWDDHYYRLVGTFLDPAFMGIILVLGIILAIWRNNRLISLFLTVTLAFTYSRASWLALLLALFVYLMRKVQRKFVIAIVIVLAATIPLLPRPGGEGVNLQRVNSVEQKLVNIEQSFEIIDLSPVFGVGLNNICSAKDVLYIYSEQNSCSGLDNSLLFVVASTGVIGLFLFIDSIIDIKRNISSKYNTLIFASTIAVFLHGMFTLTWFYPWVMGWIAILFAVGSRGSRGIRNS